MKTLKSYPKFLWFILFLSPVILLFVQNSVGETNQAAETASLTEVNAARSNEEVDHALELARTGKLVAARENLMLLLEASSTLELIETIKAHLGNINLQILTNAIPSPSKVEYIVKSGDTLRHLAISNNVTVDLIKAGNHLKSDKIRIGQRLRIHQGNFAVVINKVKNTLTVLDDDEFVKQYAVGTGEFNKTPVGAFKITDRIPQPVWYKDGSGPGIPYGDPENILGDFWLGLDIPGYGIHGTNDPATIGSQSSAGCIRLLNRELAELFMLLPVGTPVIITE